jgi:hypothetical protein
MLAAMSRLLVVVALLGALAGCAAPVAGASGTPGAAPPRTLDGPRLEADVRDYLAHDPATAPLTAGRVECPPSAVVDPRVVVFCQVVGVGRVWSVPVTVLDDEGDYRIDKPF